jgi:hypothetical protein
MRKATPPAGNAPCASSAGSTRIQEVSPVRPLTTARRGWKLATVTSEKVTRNRALERSRTIVSG